MPIKQIGYLSAFSLAYALKFLWAPAVDFLGTRRGWIAKAQILMAASVILLLPQNPQELSICLCGVMGALAVLSATQDIAIDAYSIEMLKLSEMGMANGVRIAAYKVATVVAGSFLVWLAGQLAKTTAYLEGAEQLAWTTAYLGAAAVLLILALTSMRLPPVEIKRQRVSLSSVAASLKDIVQRPGLIQVVAFILLFKAGDVTIAPMVRAFWVDWGLTPQNIGIAGTISVFCSVSGGLVGGIVVSRWGIFNGLWFLGFWQAAGHLFYAWVASTPGAGTGGIYFAAGADAFFGGSGTAAFLAFLMSICKKQYSATQYALLSSLFQMPAVLFGMLSGHIVANIGYSWFFVATFTMGLPALAFVFHAREWVRINADSSEPTG